MRIETNVYDDSSTGHCTGISEVRGRIRVQASIFQVFLTTA